MDKVPFSSHLERWGKGKSPKTLAGLSKVFAEKSFGVIILILMAVPALPIPTGGITHIFEIIAMLLALELMSGRRIVWLPKKWQRMKIGGGKHDRIIPFMARRIKWFERFSRPRLSGLMNDSRFLRAIGLIIFVLTFAAFLAPPFSGLDTLPALGVVLICLSLILEDAVLLLAGLIIGGIGVALEVGIGSAITIIIRRLF